MNSDCPLHGQSCPDGQENCEAIKDNNAEETLLSTITEMNALPLRPFDRGDWNCWAGTEKPDGFEPQIADIKVAGLPGRQLRDRGRPVTVFFRPEGTLLVDATGISIVFNDRNDRGWVLGMHKPCADFSLAVEVAKSLRPTMKFNVLLALGFEADQ